jgi:hypothetical protein
MFIFFLLLIVVLVIYLIINLLSGIVLDCLAINNQEDLANYE